MNTPEYQLPEREFYMMRHGQTNLNKADIAQGRTNAPLNYTGLLQGDKAGDIVALLDPKPTHTICSNMDRAVETAIMAGLLDDVNTAKDDAVRDRRLNERSFGRADGKMTGHEIRKMGRDPDGGKEKVRRLSIETEHHHKGRVMEAMAEHLERLPEGAVPIFVTHGGTMGRVLSTQDINHTYVGNTAVMKFTPPKQKGDNWTVTRYELDNGKLKASEVVNLPHSAAFDEWRRLTYGNVFSDPVEVGASMPAPTTSPLTTSGAAR